MDAGNATRRWSKPYFFLSYRPDIGLLGIGFRSCECLDWWVCRCRKTKKNLQSIKNSIMITLLFIKTSERYCVLPSLWFYFLEDSVHWVSLYREDQYGRKAIKLRFTILPPKAFAKCSTPTGSIQFSHKFKVMSFYVQRIWRI